MGGRKASVVPPIEQVCPYPGCMLQICYIGYPHAKRVVSHEVYLHGTCVFDMCMPSTLHIVYGRKCVLLFETQFGSKLNSGPL